MTLSTGVKLGPYEIIAPLGAGGMGEVYRAKDTRLGRDVAIKVLPSHLSASPELRHRFEREAKAISQLTHPHICTLHDVGSEGGVDFLVMELLEGQSLADRLDKGPLPPEQVVKFGIEIAGALDRAHRAGIVHRDLKPGNVMLTKSGVKLLDFGLAKIASATEPLADVSALPTQAAPSRPLTEKGTVMGTFQYMAPEQLEGKEADSRTDIFAFGCVLYEMATGKKAFSGANRASLVTAIMSKEPEPISVVVPLTPPALERVVRTCLAKDPDDRWQSARDIQRELEWIAQAGSQAGVPAVVVSRRKSRERLGWVAAIVAAAVASAFVSRRFLSRSGAESGSIRFEIPSPGTVIGAAALSPDGRSLAFAGADASGINRLWIRSIDSVEPLRLEVVGDVTSALSLAWSPDGRSLVLPIGHRLTRIALAGSTATPVCSTQNSFGLSWGSSGVVVFTSFYGSGIFQVPASGGTPSAVTSLDRSAGEVAHLWPQFLPDGRRFLFFIRTKAGKESHQGWIASASLDGKPDGKNVRRIVAADGLVGVAQGYLLYTLAGAIYAQPFDAASLSLRGEPAAIPGRPYIEGSIVDPNTYVEGATLVFRSDPPKLRRLVFVDRGGRELSQVGPPQAYDRRISISPDGRRALVMRRSPERGDDDIWMLDLERGTAARSGSGVEEEGSPVWSPDGSRFVHGWDREGPYDLAIRTVDGSRPDEVVVQTPFDKECEDWSRDGRFILFQNHDPNNSGLDVLTVGSSAAPQHLRGSEHSREFALSPDARWLLSTSAESGRREVYVQRFPDGSGRQQVSVNGGAASRWNPNGQEIFFVSPDEKLMSVSFEASGGAPRLSIPAPLFSMSRVQLEESYPGSQVRNWDVMPDGKRFLIFLPVSETDRSSLTVVLNWAAQLEH